MPTSDQITDTQAASLANALPSDIALVGTATIHGAASASMQISDPDGLGWLKLYFHESVAEREFAALQALQDCGYTPRVGRWVDLGEHLRVGKHLVRHGFVRAYIEGRCPSDGLTAAEIETTKRTVQEFAALCTTQNIVMADPKVENLVVGPHGVHWVDLGGFKVLSDDASSRTNEWNSRIANSVLGKLDALP